MHDPNSQTPTPCLLNTWQHVESELFHWLFRQSQNEALAFDLLQETFLRALQQRQQFCDITNQRAWLYRVSGNLLRDEWRYRAKQVEFPGSWGDEVEEKAVEDAPVDSLTQCLPRALTRLSVDDRTIIEQCDLQGISQQMFAKQYGLSLPATKSRLQRARLKLKQTLKAHCQIHFDEQQRVSCFFPPK